MVVDYRYELGFIEVGVRFYPVDGAQVTVNEYTDNGWDCTFESRVIAEGLREYVETGLYGAGLSDEVVENFLDNFEYQLENGLCG